MTRMSIVSVGLSVLLLSAHLKAQDDLDSVLAKAMKDSRVPAMAVLRIQHGKVTGEAARGVRSVDSPDTVTAKDVWHIGSDGKAMTAAMIARLVSRHKLSWGAPLETLLPKLAAGMRPAYRSVTLRDLLSHQAGLQANIEMSALDAFRSDPRPMHELRLAYATLALAQKPAYPPRTDNLYSNNGLVIAATVAEQVTGMSYEQLMQSEVFAPLHMSSAAFGPTGKGQTLGHGSGRPQTGPDADNAPVIAPVGEIHLTMQDWARFAIDQMAGEDGRGKLFSEETYKYLHTPGRPGSEFALGWLLSPSLAGVTGPFLTHSGSNTYWYAVIVLNPTSLSGLLVAANAGQDAGADKIEGSVVKELLPKL
jgi:CubicO group peptidase (beta-lactamase class C family)